MCYYDLLRILCAVLNVMTWKCRDCCIVIDRSALRSLSWMKIIISYGSICLERKYFKLPWCLENISMKCFPSSHGFILWVRDHSTVHSHHLKLPQSELQQDISISIEEYDASTYLQAIPVLLWTRVQQKKIILPFPIPTKCSTFKCTCNDVEITRTPLKSLGKEKSSSTAAGKGSVPLSCMTPGASSKATTEWLKYTKAENE